MNTESLEEKYPKLKSEFPDLFIFLFTTDGTLNEFGKLAQELYELRKAISPFAEIAHSSNGRIPTEKLSARNWHDLTKAMRR